jgi:hypothetical protein
MRNLSPRNIVYLLVHGIIFLGGVVLIRFDSTILVGLGSSLIATGIAGWVIFVYVFVAEQTAQRLDMLTQFGFLEALAARSSVIKPKYDERLAEAREAIDILGFGLQDLRQDYLRDFETWASRARVRILLLDPDAPRRSAAYADQRDREEGNPPGTIRTDVDAFLQQTASIRANIVSGFRYDCIPVFLVSTCSASTTSSSGGHIS